jgi:hypothetical protein
MLWFSVQFSNVSPFFFITGVAISQCSSIWFDILGWVINLRGTGGKPEPKPTSAPETA